MDRSKAAPDEGSKDAGWENPGADFLQLGLARAPVGGLSAYLADQLRGAIADGRLPGSLGAKDGARTRGNCRFSARKPSWRIFSISSRWNSAARSTARLLAGLGM